ncbi:MAG: acriflavine resistance protein B [Cyclobacteriaceae bacterium]|nr:MAG: acriflavine resistance protein B [Cyclobacteriaceae bacterium]
MIQRIITFSIQNRLVVAVFTLAILIAGIWSIGKVPIDAVPDITNNQVQVITQAPNLSTEDIEQFVTYQVELAMSNLPGVLEIRSISRFGLSAVTIVFEDGMGTYLPRQLVAEKLEQIKSDIPEAFGSPFMGPITTGLGEIYQYTLEVDSAYRDQYSLYDLRSIQDWIIRRQMAMVPGVIEVNAFGGMIKQYEVAVNPYQLNAMGLTTEDVFRALERNNENTGGAYIEYDHRANYIRGEGIIKSLKDIENIVVRNIKDVPVLIKDVAQVGLGHDVRYGAFTQDGTGEAVGGIILMLKGENSKEVIMRVKERMTEIQNSLPDGVSITPFLDRSELINNTTSTVQKNLAEGALIVIFVLVFLLGNWRGGLIVASTIPLSLLFAFILMNAFDVWANLMSLGAIDFGIIVDGAVIIVEGTVYILHQKLVKKELVTPQVQVETAGIAANKMMNSAFFGQLIILIVFLPILALEGIEGKMFKPMALTFMFAMIGVMILCLTYVPMMCSWFLKADSSGLSLGNNLVSWLEEKYQRTLGVVLKSGIWLVIVSVLLLVMSGFLFTRLGGEFIPRLDEGDIAFHDILKPGSALEEAIKVTTQVENVLLDEFPEVDRVLSRIGVSEVPIDLMPMDVADCYIKLKPRSEWTTTDSKEKLIERIKSRLEQIPGVTYEFTQPIEMRFNELMTGIRQDVAIKIYGEDLNILANKADEVASLVADIEGVGDLRVEATEGQPQISINYDRNKLAFYGIDIADLNQSVKTAFAGRKAGVVFEGERRFDLVIRLEDRFRSELQDVKKLLVSLPSGAQVPLDEIAAIGYKSEPMQISREGTNRRTYVGINVRGRDIKSLVEEIEGVLQANLELPPGYYIRYGGAFENLERATERLQVVVPVSLVLIFILVFLALRSFKQTIMIYIAIPLSAIGGVLSLWIRDMPFSISAGIGFIVLFGVAVLNGLVLINGWNDLKSHSKLSLSDRVVQGAKRRLRPILLTASTDILGFLPMALSKTAGAEVQRPLATVVIGGMITATLLTLFLLPVLYQWIEKRRGPVGKPLMVSLLLGLMICTQPLAAQQQPAETPLAIDQAVAIAIARYPEVNMAKLNIQKQERLKKTSWDFGRTGVFTAAEEQGDADLGVNTIVGFQQQNIDLFSAPAKNKLQMVQVDIANTETQLTIRQLTRLIKNSYAEAFVAKERKALLEQIDSIYRDFEKAVELKYQVEESSGLEHLAAVNQSREISIQKDQAHFDYVIALNNLNKWLLSDTLFTVTKGDGQWLEPDKATDYDVNLHPELQLARDRLALTEQKLTVQKAGYLPKLNLMYGIQEVNGIDGFYQYQAGLSFPLIFNSQQGKVQAARIDQEISRQDLVKRSVELKTQLNLATANYQKWLASWQYYQQQAVVSARKQLDGATLSYQEGNIDYISFLQHTHTAIEIELKGLEAMGNYLQAKFYLEYLSE